MKVTTSEVKEKSVCLRRLAGVCREWGWRKEGLIDIHFASFVIPFLLLCSQWSIKGRHRASFQGHGENILEAMARLNAKSYHVPSM